MSSATDDFDIDFSTASKEIPRYSAEVVRQMADRFIAQECILKQLINVTAKTQHLNKLFGICEQTFWTSYFFPEIMLESWGCGLYTTLYGRSKKTEMNFGSNIQMTPSYKLPI